MTTKICPTCETRFIDGVHYWSGTGKRGNPKDLAGLVCNTNLDRPSTPARDKLVATPGLNEQGW